jgi:hypothetical protein
MMPAFAALIAVAGVCVCVCYLLMRYIYMARFDWARVGPGQPGPGESRALISPPPTTYRRGDTHGT